MKHKLLFCIILTVAAAPVVWVVWAFQVTYGPGGLARQSQCISNVKQVVRGLLLYSADNDGRLPPATKWMDGARVPKDVLRCPEVHDQEAYGYAMFESLSSFSIEEAPKPSTQLLVFESNDLSRNAVGPPRRMASPPRHRDGNIVGYLDGHAALLQPN